MKRKFQGKKNKNQEKEKKLFYKSVILVVYFYISYAPLIGTACYEYATQLPASAEIDYIGLFFVAFYSVGNSLLLIYLDAGIRADIKLSFQALLSNWQMSESKSISVSPQHNTPGPSNPVIPDANPTNLQSFAQSFFTPKAEMDEDELQTELQARL